MKFLTLHSTLGGEIDICPFKIVTMQSLAGKSGGTRLSLERQCAPYYEDVSESRADIKKKISDLFKVKGE